MWRANKFLAIAGSVFLIGCGGGSGGSSDSNSQTSTDVSSSSGDSAATDGHVATTDTGATDKGQTTDVSATDKGQTPDAGATDKGQTADASATDKGQTADAGATDGGGGPCASAVPACEAYCRMVCENCGDNPGAANACGGAKMAAGGGVCSACIGSINAWASTCPAPDPMPTCGPPPPTYTTGTLEATIDGVAYQYTTQLAAKYQAPIRTVIDGFTAGQAESIRVVFPGDQSGTFNCGSAAGSERVEIIASIAGGEFSANSWQGSCTIIVSSYGAVGEPIVATFTATLSSNSEGGTGQAELTKGSIDLIRQDNN